MFSGVLGEKQVDSDARRSFLGGSIQQDKRRFQPEEILNNWLIMDLKQSLIK